MISLILLVAAGIATGIVATVGGIGSIVSYPSLLAFGLPPIAANVTNTTALAVLLPSTVAGGRMELRTIGVRVLVLSGLAAGGGAAGALLLLRLSAASFEAVVPLLVAAGSLLVLGRDRLRAWIDDRVHEGDVEGSGSLWVLAGSVVLVGVFTGYFGAGSGILMLAVLSLYYEEPHAVTNAVRLVVTAAANGLSTVVFVFVAPVDWPAAGAMACGLMIGTAAGMRIVPRLDAGRLRQVIGFLGLLLAIWLAISRRTTT
jgi:uncharacterized membrane protein YfcA